MAPVLPHRYASVVHGRTGFSLAELLVALAVASALAGLLLMGATTVGQRATCFRCQANLHQLSIAIGMYVADYRTLPLVSYGGPDDLSLPRRPPSPPHSHNIALVLGGYVSDGQIMECPMGRRVAPGLGYNFNSSASGLPPSQIRTPTHRAMIMCDPWLPAVLRGQGGRQNALFLDGHVKAYEWVHQFSLTAPSAEGVPFWPPD